MEARDKHICTDCWYLRRNHISELNSIYDFLKNEGVRLEPGERRLIVWCGHGDRVRWLPPQDNVCELYEQEKNPKDLLLKITLLLDA